MTREVDIDTPTLRVNVYEAGRLITRIPCESSDEASGVFAEWEALEGIECEVEDIGTTHPPEDAVAPEPDDAFESDDPDVDYGDGTL